MRKLLPLLMLLLLLPAAALAATSADFTVREMGFTYDITSDEQWLLLIWDGKDEDGRKLLYSPEGHFTGTVEMPHSGQGGKLVLKLEDLTAKTVLREDHQLPQAPNYKAPTGQSNATVRGLTLTETPTGFKYSFTAEGTDFQYLYYRSKQESATVPIYPVNASGLYEGEIEMPLTYARTLITVQVVNGKGVMKKEGTVRKGYEAPPAPEAKEGRLSGVIVCIDPGHQEDGVPTREPVGPGLSGYGTGGSGMAQGRTTLRKESIVCLEAGMMLRDLLIQEGATVVMTREVNRGAYSNMERCAVANDAGAHIMLRLHCDTNANRSKKGLSVWCPLNSEYAQAVCSKAEYRRLAEIFLDEMKTAVGYELAQKTGYVSLTDKFIGNNWAKMLCFLVEMGFMSNPEEDLKLASPEYQRILAEGMVEGIYKIALERGWVTE
jgi:N-acetylmuramoyl-L-alanine amidase